MSEIHGHGHGHDHGLGHEEHLGDKGGEIKGKGDAKIHKGSPDKTEEQKSIVEKDEWKNDVQEPNIQDQSIDDASEKTQYHKIASGFRYNTLSRNQLDSLDPNQPKIADTKRILLNQSTPPHDSGGTGNPFFNPNPMTTFFSVFLYLLQELGQLEKAAARLTAMEMLATQNAGQSQAAATLAAGKAQAASDYKQAYTQFASAGVSVIQLGGSIHDDSEVSDAAAVQKGTQEGEANEAEETADSENYRANAMNTKKWASEDTEPWDAEADKPGTITVTSNAKQEKRIHELNKAQQASDEMYDDRMAAANLSNEEKTRLYNQKMQRHQDYENLKKDYESYCNRCSTQEGKDDLKKEIDHEGVSRLEQEQKAQAARTAAKQARRDVSKYDFKGTNAKAWETRASLKNNTRYHDFFQSGGQAASYALQGLGNMFKAQGEEQSAYYQMLSQLYSTYGQMFNSALGGDTSLMQDAYAQGGALMDALKKMSDQTTQFHFTV